jgi:hypothetical protein
MGSAAAIAAGRFVTPPRDVPSFVIWVIAVTVTVGAVTVVFERVGRRLIPFAWLLRLGVVFPDRVPSRFSVALRSSPVRELQRQVLDGNGDEPTTAAALLALVARITAHDRRTRGHSERVRAYTELLGKQMGLSPDDLSRLRWASLLHDVGKVAVPGDVLNKAGSLAAQELELIHRHPIVGHRMIAPVAAWLGPWADSILEHHERFDGRGYPRGLSGASISLGARIVAVADAYEVMVTGRLYRGGLDELAARRELVRCSGSQFDPAVVRAFLLVPVRKLRWATGIGTWLGELPFLPGVRLAGRALAAAGAGTAAVVMAGTGMVATPHVAAVPAPAPRRVSAPRVLGATAVATRRSSREESTPDATPTTRPTYTPPEPDPLDVGTPNFVQLPGVPELPAGTGSVSVPEPPPVSAPDTPRTPGGLTPPMVPAAVGLGVVAARRKVSP